MFGVHPCTASPRCFFQDSYKELKRDFFGTSKYNTPICRIVSAMDMVYKFCENLHIIEEDQHMRLFPESTGGLSGFSVLYALSFLSKFLNCQVLGLPFWV